MSQSVVSNKITLVYSGVKGGYLHIPLSILFLAESLIKNKFDVKLIDLRVQDLTPDDLKGILYLGVSHMTGSMQIPPALKCAEMAKAMNIPVVFGGTHPSILTEETASHKLVDIAVKGEGEDIIVELAEYFQHKRDINSIKGIAYKDKTGQVVYTGDRIPPKFDRITHLPYHLLNMDKYIGTSVDFGYQSSRGCPHRCAFCAEVGLYPKTWRTKSAEIIIEEIENIINKFNPKRIFFLDSNFFCSKKRVEEFCNLVIARGIKVEFFGECRFDYFYRYDEQFINLLKKAGFNEIEFGGESGSDKTLDFIKKDITAKQIIHGIEKCKQAGLKSFTSFMIGFPGEPEEEMLKTLDIYDLIKKYDSDNARINGMFIYTPMPGTELYRTVVEQWGFINPKTLEEWSKYELYDISNVTWFDEKKKKKLQTISTLVRFFFVYNTLKKWNFSQKVIRHNGYFKAIASILFHETLYPIARLRWKLRLFNYGYEWQLWLKIFHIYMGRK
ncbi:MAG: B12-binding domain-containing radical SAM protein [Desulfamplus sp.]|nr:B12-binding domain-containing radical SAM protein [Desulfamplus sp.]